MNEGFRKSNDPDERRQKLLSRLLDQVVDGHMPFDRAQARAHRWLLGDPWGWMVDEEVRLKSAIEALGDADDYSSRSDALRAWWYHVWRMLKIFSSNMGGSSGTILQAPCELLQRLAGMSDYLRRGIVPGPISGVVQGGRPPIGPEEERHIKYAAAYIQAVKAKKLLGKQPISTIAKRFGVKRQTAQRWAKEPVGQYLLSITEHNPRHLVRLVVPAARKYSQGAGRSSIALSSRVGKVPS